MEKNDVNFCLFRICIWREHTKLEPVLSTWGLCAAYPQLVVVGYLRKPMSLG
jgi:hypothetical protein